MFLLAVVISIHCATGVINGVLKNDYLELMSYPENSRSKHISISSSIFSSCVMLVILFLIPLNHRYSRYRRLICNEETHKTRQRRVLHVHLLPLVNDILALCGVCLLQISKTSRNWRSSVFVFYTFFYGISSFLPDTQKAISDFVSSDWRSRSEIEHLVSNVTSNIKKK